MQPDKELQKLTNRGWQQMRQTLDLELPEQPRRRSGWWFWLLPTAFLLASGGYFLLPNFENLDQNSNPNLNQNSIQNLNEKPVEKPTAAPSPTAEPVASNRAAENLTGKKSGDEMTAFAGSAANFSNQKIENGQVAAAKRSIFSNQKTENKQPAEAISSTKISQKTGATTKNPDQVSEKTATAAEANSSSVAHPTFQKSLDEWATAPLPTPIFSINFENKNHASPVKPTLPQPIEKAKRESNWSFGATAGGIASNLWRPNGWSAGTIGDWKIAPRWTVRAGLNFQKLNYKLTDGQVIATVVSPQVFKDLTGQDAFASNSSSPNVNDTTTTLAIPVNSLARVELPLQVQFFINKNWYFSAGATLARTVGAETNYEIIGLQKDNAAADADVQLDRHVRLNTPNWSKFWTFGTGYQFSKRLEINLLLRQNWKKGHSATWTNHSNFFADASDLAYQKSASAESFDLHNVSYKRLRPELQVGLVWKFFR